MKNKRPQKKLRIATIAIICAIASILVIGLILSAQSNAGKKIPAESPENYFIENSTKLRVHENYRPVLIYRYRETNRPAFTGIGTWFEGTNGPIVATVDHLLQRKFSNELFVVRFLSPLEHTVTNGIQAIAYRNIDVGLPKSEDVLFLRPKANGASKLPCFSEFTEDAPSDITIYFTDKAEIGGRTIRKIKSLVTGIEYPVIGLSVSPRRVMIQYQSLKGHSGTGFIDEYGQLYVLSGSPSDSKISMLCGPYANLNKRL